MSNRSLDFVTLAHSRKLSLHALIEARNVDDHTLMRAVADRFQVVARFHPERQCAAFNRNQLGGRPHAHSDRGRGEVANIEVDSENF